MGFFYNEVGHLIGEYDENGNPIREYLWFGDMPLAINDQSGATDATYYLHTDHLNTPKAATDDNQNIVWSADYTPFGEVTETVSTIEQPLRFPGQYYDAETGLNYNYFRSYNSATGRYTQSDPIGLMGGLNSYAYSMSTPVLLSDFYGLYAEPAAPAIGPRPDADTWPSGLDWPRVSPAAAVCTGLMLATYSTDVGVGSDVVPRSCKEPGAELGRCGIDDDDARCEQAIAQARRIYNELRTRSIPQYMRASRHGEADSGHYTAILQGQQSLRNAIVRVKAYCKTLPPELPEWERLANQNFPPRH